MKFTISNRTLKFFYLVLFLAAIQNTTYTRTLTWNQDVYVMPVSFNPNPPHEQDEYHWQINGTQNVANSVQISGVAVVDAGYTWNQGPWFFVYDGATLKCKGTMNFNNVSGCYLSGKIEVYPGGTLNINASYLAMRTGSKIYNYGGTINISSNLTLDTGSLEIWKGTVNVIGANGRIYSDGAINIGNGLLDIQTTGILQNATVASLSRTITVTGGELRISGGELHNGANANGNIVISNSGKLTANTGYLYNGYSTGSGNISMSAGNLTFNSDALIYNGYAQPGSISVSGGTFLSTTTFNNGNTGAGSGSLTISGAGNVNLYKSRCEIGNAATGTINLNGGSLTYSGTINVNKGNLTITSGSLDIPLSSILTISPSGQLANSGTINNYGTYVNHSPTSILGTFNNYGSIFDFTQPQSAEIAAGTTATVPAGYTLSVLPTEDLHVKGTLKNLSSTSIDINGNVYVYNILENGSSGVPGTVNVKFGGSLINLGGIVENKDAGSAINVLSGGNLFNYLGDIDTTLGTLTINSGGQYQNVRGTYPTNLTLNNGSTFFEYEEIVLNNDLDLDYIWTITNKTIINGYNHKINLGTTGAIRITGNASVMFKNLSINDVSENKIRCTDNITTLSIDNVTWTQDADYSFTKGKIYVAGDWTINGNETTFSYESDQIITLTSNSTLKLDLATFKYNTTPNDRFVAVDDSSIIHLDNGAILASQACKISNATLLTSGLSTLRGDSTLDLSSLYNINIAGSTIRTGNVILGLLATS